MLLEFKNQNAFELTFNLVLLLWEQDMLQSQYFTYPKEEAEARSCVCTLTTSDEIPILKLYRFEKILSIEPARSCYISKIWNLLK